VIRSCTRAQMITDPQGPAGWSLREAIRRAVDRELLKRCFGATRDWRRISPAQQRSALRSRSGGLTPERRVLSELERSNAAVGANLLGCLSAGQLIAWGRREFPTAERKPIPPSAWRYLAVENSAAAILYERTAARTPIYDVRVYPTVDAPNAIEQLTNQTLVHAFERFVFGDPQFVLSCQRAQAIGGRPLGLGFDRRLFEAIWPVDCGKNDHWEKLIKLIHAPQTGRPHRASCFAGLVLGRRFARLIDYLATGELVAVGINQSGQNEIIPRSMWIRKRTHLDLGAGDLIEDLPDAPSPEVSYSSPLYRAIMLRAPGFHVEPIGSAGIRSDTTEQQPVGGGRLAETPRSASVSPETKGQRIGGKSAQVIAAAKQAGIDLSTSTRGSTDLAGEIGQLLATPPKTEHELDALRKLIERVRKQLRSGPSCP
jgi:hypothetical protein